MDAKDKKVANNAIGYYLLGEVPQKFSWTYSEEGFCDLIKRYVRKIIPEFNDVTLEYNTSTGEIITFAWIHKNSSHLVDQSMKNMRNVAVKVTTSYMSDELRDFTRRFCPKKQSKPIEAINNNNLIGFIVDPLKIIDIVFDRSGDAAEKEFGYRPPNTSITLTPKFSRLNDLKYGRLDLIEITKSTAKKYNQKPKAKRNFKH